MATKIVAPQNNNGIWLQQVIDVNVRTLSIFIFSNHLNLDIFQCYHLEQCCFQKTRQYFCSYYLTSMNDHTIYDASYANIYKQIYNRIIVNLLFHLKNIPILTENLNNYAGIYQIGNMTNKQFRVHLPIH